MTESIFNEQPPVDPTVVPSQTTEAPQPPAADDSLLKAILNEQGVQKYQSVTDALKALQSSQEHIKRIEQENAQLRELATKARAAEAIAATLKPTDPPSPAADSLAGKDLESVVERVLSLKESQKQAVENQREVANVLTEAFGQDKAKDVFYSKAEELGFSREEINSLAAKNPKAVIRLFLGDKQPSKPSPAVPGIRPDALKEKPAVPKSGMTLGSTADLLDSWRAAGQRVKQN